jgi:hypothetical protein
MKKQIILAALTGIILGGVLGFWGAGFLAKKRIKKFKAKGGSEMLDKRVFRHIPPSSDQVKSFEDIRRTRGAELDSLTIKHRKDIHNVLKQTLQELEPLLTPEQKEELAKLKQRNRRFLEQKKGKRKRKRE